MQQEQCSHALSPDRLGLDVRFGSKADVVVATAAVNLGCPGARGDSGNAAGLQRNDGFRGTWRESGPFRGCLPPRRECYFDLLPEWRLRMDLIIILLLIVLVAS